MADAIIWELRGSLMRSLADSCDRHFEGLAMAAKHLKAVGCLDGHDVAWCSRLDVTYHVLEHATAALKREKLAYFKGQA